MALLLGCSPLLGHCRGATIPLLLLLLLLLWSARGRMRFPFAAVRRFGGLALALAIAHFATLGSLTQHS
jgi:hypothetical protein